MRIMKIKKGLPFFGLKLELFKHFPSIVDNELLCFSHQSQITISMVRDTLETSFHYLSVLFFKLLYKNLR